MLKSCSTILVSCLLLFMLSASQLLAQNTTHQVQAGETLFGIAEKYQITVQQLKDWNNLGSSRLSVGQQLVIKKQDSAPAAGAITHTVEPKETLFSISKRYNVSMDKIKEWNDLQGSSLAIGTTLTLYPEQSQQPAANTKSSSAGSYYTVKSGDSLFRIAQIHNMSVEKLKQLNDLSSNNIRVGQRLAIQATDRPPSLAKTGVESSAQGKFIRYELKKSQSRTELLETFQMDESEFRALNPGLSTTSFRKGDAVNILAPPTRTFSNPYTAESGLSTLGTTAVTRYESEKNDPTTSGELYNADALTAAHSNIAIGSVIFIQNDTNKQGVFVRINDRTTGNGLKVSAAAWKALGLTSADATVTMFRNNE